MKKAYKTIAIILFFLVALYGMLYLIPRFVKEEAKKYDEYNRLAETAVTIDAKITYMEPNYSTEGSPDYDAYVSYEYNGIKYDNKHYRTYSSDDNYGKTIQIEIDPENPDTIRPHFQNTFSLEFLCVAMFLCEMSVYIFTVPLISAALVNKKWKKLYKNSTLDPETVTADIKFENRCKLILCAGLGVIFMVSDILICVNNYAQTHTFTVSKMYSIALIAYFIFVSFSAIRSIITSQKIIIVPDTLQSTNKELADSGVAERFVWNFTHCRNWKPIASACVPYGKITLDTITVGTEVYLALNKCNKIKRIYKAEDFELKKHKLSDSLFNT